MAIQSLKGPGGCEDIVQHKQPTHRWKVVVSDEISRRTMVVYADEWDLIGLGAEILRVGWIKMA